MAVSGDLSARVEKDGLRVQVRGGRYSVSVDARVEGHPKAIGLPKEPPRDPWPPREVWVFQADEAQRQVELSGLAPIDPSRTELPEAWRALPAFLVEPGASLALAEVRRGEAEPPPDALTLSREMWLDPDGRAASVRDHFGGTLRSTTRLDLVPPGTPGRIAVDGQDQLVTGHPETKAAGVELRRAALQLEADSRLALGGSIPAVGWTTGVEQLQATLHVPPGWSLLAASGVDQVPGTWTSRWTLLAFFFVLIVTLAVYRLFGRGAAAVALAALVLLHGEPDAPSAVWLSLVAAIALQRVAPAGRIARLARLWFLASVAVLVYVVVPFARDQVKDALFPQVADVEAWSAGAVPATPARLGLPGAAGAAMNAPAPTPPPMEADQAQVVDEVSSLEARSKREMQALPEAKAAKRQDYAYNLALEQDPKAVLQTGPGVPTWSWRSYSLAWSGPVGRDHRMRLMLASPGANRLLTLLRLGLLATLGLVLLTGRWPSLPRRTRPEPVIAVLALLLFPAAARAQQGTPSPDILQELRQRLTRPAPCEPRCVTTPSLALRLDATRLAMSVEVHAAADGTWAVPGPVGSWVPAEVRVDGAPAVAVARLGDGFLHLRLARGVHRVEASGPVPPGDSFTLQFADPPRRARADAPGWDVTGLRQDGPADPSISLTRRLAARVGAAGSEGRYAPWLEVTRTLGFGVTWTVTTRVRRVTPLGAPIALRVPLLPGEAPTRANLVVEKGEVAVSLGGDETETGVGVDARAEAAGRPARPRGPLVVRGLEALVQPDLVLLRDGPAPRLAPRRRRLRPRVPPVARRGGDGRPRPPAGRRGPDPDDRRRPARGRARPPPRARDPARDRPQQPRAAPRPAHPQGGRGPAGHDRRPGAPVTAGRRRAPPDRPRRPPRDRGPLAAGPRHGRLPRDAARRPLEPRRQRHAAAHDPARALARRDPRPRLGPGRPLLALRRVPARGGPRPRPRAREPSHEHAVGPPRPRPERPPGGRGALRGGVRLRPRPARPATAAKARWPSTACSSCCSGGPSSSLGILYVAIHQGLLFRPDMQVAGNGSTDTVLRWYADRVAADTPAAGVLSLPLWLYRVAMLLWALWLAASLVRGVGPAWRAFTEGGAWRRVLRTPKAPKPLDSPEPPNENTPKA